MDEARLRGIAFEADYWKQVLGDLDELNRGLAIIADHVLDTSVGFVMLGIRRDVNEPQATQGLRAAHAALDEVQAMQAKMLGMLGLVRGRTAALEAEATEAGA